MVLSAEYIKKKLEQEMVLSQAFGRDLVRHFPCPWALAVPALPPPRQHWGQGVCTVEPPPTPHKSGSYTLL